MNKSYLLDGNIIAAIFETTYITGFVDLVYKNDLAFGLFLFSIKMFLPCRVLTFRGQNVV